MKVKELAENLKWLPDDSEVHIQLKGENVPVLVAVHRIAEGEEDTGTLTLRGISVIRPTRRVIEKYTVKNTPELLEFLDVAEACGYTWKSGDKPTDYLSKDHLGLNNYALCLWNDRTMTYGGITGREVPFNGECAMLVYNGATQAIQEEPEPVTVKAETTSEEPDTTGWEGVPWGGVTWGDIQRPEVK